MSSNPVAQTAFGPMVLAAIEHNEAPGRRLVDDDLAESFLPAQLRALVRAARIGPVRKSVMALSERSGPGLWASIACRKRFIDERLSDPLNDVGAVVILGSGLDTRPYRIARHSSLPVFEVDQRVNIERKIEVVNRVIGSVPESVRLVAVDFEHDDLMATLHQAGYRDEGRTLFIWEGVTQYLSRDAVLATFEQIRQSRPGTRLIFTYVRQDFIDGVNLYDAQVLYNKFSKRRQIWQTGFVPEQLEEFLRGYDWRLIEQAGPGYYRDTYIRPTGRTISASPLEWTATAIKA